MFNDEAAGEQRIVIEAVQEGITEHIGNLQLCAQHHREDEENRHTLVFKQREGIQTQHGRPALVFLLIGDWDMRQRQGEQRQYDGQRRADIQLHMAQFKAGEAYRPHRQNKADGAPDTDWREVCNNIHPG